MLRISGSRDFEKLKEIRRFLSGFQPFSLHPLPYVEVYVEWGADETELGPPGSGRKHWDDDQRGASEVSQFGGKLESGLEGGKR